MNFAPSDHSTSIKSPLLEVNPVRNSSGALNPAGIILKSNPAAEQWGIISNGVKNLSRDFGGCGPLPRYRICGAGFGQIQTVGQGGVHGDDSPQCFRQSITAAFKKSTIHVSMKKSEA